MGEGQKFLIRTGLGQFFVAFYSILLTRRGQPTFDPGTFWPLPKEIFWPEGKKLKNLVFFGEIFQTQTWPKQQKIDATQPWSKNFDPDPITSSNYSHSKDSPGISWTVRLSHILPGSFLATSDLWIFLYEKRYVNSLSKQP